MLLTISTNLSISAFERCSVTHTSRVSSAMRTPPRMPFARRASSTCCAGTVVFTANSLKNGLSYAIVHLPVATSCWAR